jgi:subtilisin family serine protease
MMTGCLLLLLAARFAVPAIGEKEVNLARELEARYMQQGRYPGGSQSEVSYPGPRMQYQEADVIAGQYVVSFRPGREQDVRDFVQFLGGAVVCASRTGGCFLVAEFSTVTQSLATSRLASHPAVAYLEPRTLVHACYTPNDPYWYTQQWDHWTMYADKAWDYARTNPDIKVCVVDQGVDYLHPDLSGSFESALKGFDFIGNDNDPYPTDPEEFHATHVAGIIGATINNSTGLAGWANVTLYSCRVLDSTGSGPIDGVADGIRWGVDHGCRVINLSLGSTSGSATLENAVNYATSNSALVIGASGNDGSPNVYYPGAYENAIAVGALDTSGIRASFSNYGAEIDLIAPGVRVISCLPRNHYGWADGTSMACPEVSGVAALLLCYKPGLTNSGVRAILEASAIDMGSIAGKDIYYGNGMVNAWRAMQLAEQYSDDDGRAQFLAASAPQPGLPSLLRCGRKLAVRSGLKVYDAQGRQLAASLLADGRLAPGVYVLRAGSVMMHLTVVN